MPYTFNVLNLDQMKFTKTVSIIASNRFGVDREIGFFIYEREISKENYTLNPDDKTKQTFSKEYLTQIKKTIQVMRLTN